MSGSRPASKIVLHPSTPQRAAQMQTFVILNIDNMRNNGCAMMAINTFNYVAKCCGAGARFYCDLSSLEDFRRVLSELPAARAVIESLKVPDFDPDGPFLFMALRQMRRARRMIKAIAAVKPCAVVILGGDDFSEYYLGYRVISRLYLVWMLSRFFPVLLLGHTVGPFKSWRRAAARMAFARSTIVSRDQASYDYCRNQLGLTQLVRGHDLAWLDLPRSRQRSNSKPLRKRYRCGDVTYLVLNPSGSYLHYSQDRKVYIATWVRLIEYLLALKSLQGCAILLMPHVFRPHEVDDRHCIREIVRQVADNARVTAIGAELLASECRELLRHCLFSVCGRMHAAVSTLQTGKPAIALSHAVKYAGVLGDELELQELVLNAAGAELWGEPLLHQLRQRIDYLLGNYAAICEKIRHRTRRIAAEQLDIVIGLTRSLATQALPGCASGSVLKQDQF